MNVYTHVSMSDLARDIEALPCVEAVSPPARLPDDGHNVGSGSLKPAGEPTVPDELAGLLENWNHLPGHIRNAISALAGV